jgi:hypothetical protein
MLHERYDGDDARPDDGPTFRECVIDALFRKPIPEKDLGERDSVRNLQRYREQRAKAKEQEGVRPL